MATKTTSKTGAKSSKSAKAKTKEVSTMTTPVLATSRKSSKSAETEEHPLNHLVPPSWFADDYVSRSFSGWTDVALLEYAKQVRHNVLMFGPTGPGKTSCVYAYAAQENIPVVNVACNGAIDPSTMFVRPVIGSTSIEDVMAALDEVCTALGVSRAKVAPADLVHYWSMAATLCGNKVELVESDVVAVMRHGGIVYLDEVNFMPPRVAAVLHGALDKRRTIVLAEKGNEAIKLHPDCQIIGTYNPGYGGTKPLNEAFKNRFALQLAFDYNPEIEKQFITSIPSLHDLAEKLRTAHDNGDIETPTGPNLLAEFETFAQDLGVDFAIDNFMARFEADERSSVRKFVEHFQGLIQQETDAWLSEQQ